MFFAVAIKAMQVYSYEIANKLIHSSVKFILCVKVDYFPRALGYICICTCTCTVWAFQVDLSYRDKLEK